MDDKRRKRIDKRITVMRRRLRKLEKQSTRDGFTWSTEQPIVEVGIQALRDELRRLGEERARLAREVEYWKG